MAETAKKTSPPYAAFSAFLNFLNKLRDTQVPSRIDPTVFGNVSGSLSYSVIASLKSLKLIDADGKPFGSFITLVKASDDDRKALMQAILKDGYPTLWDGSIDLASATAGQFDEHIREAYDVKGSTVDKVATFFIAAAKFSGLEISPHLAARKAIASSASAGKSKKQRKVDDGNGGSGSTFHSPSPQPFITEKALEYRLVDLLGEASGKPEVMKAIIEVITFLKTKDQNIGADRE